MNKTSLQIKQIRKSIYNDFIERGVDGFVEAADITTTAGSGVLNSANI